MIHNVRPEPVRSCSKDQVGAMSKRYGISIFYSKCAKSESADPDDGAIFARQGIAS